MRIFNSITIILLMLASAAFSNPIVIDGDADVNALINNGVATFEDNQNEQVDYIIAMTIVFGAGNDEFDADVVIEAGTTIQFRLHLDGGEVDSTYSIWINGNDYSIQCGDIADQNERWVTFEPEPNIVNEYPVGSGDVFSGGIVVLSTNQDNCFERTTFTHMLGQKTIQMIQDHNERWVWPWYVRFENDNNRWVLTRVNHSAVQIGYINYLGEHTTAFAEFEDVVVDTCFMNGINVLGNTSQASFTDCTIEGCYGNPPTPAEGQNYENWSMGNGIYCSGNQQDIQIFSNEILDNNGNGITLHGSETSVNISGSHIDRNGFVDTDNDGLNDRRMNCGISCSNWEGDVILNIDTSTISYNAQDGIIFKGDNENQIEIADNSQVRGNGSSGIYLQGHFNRENPQITLTVGDLIEGNCLVDSNGYCGIRIETDNTIVQCLNYSHVDNNSYGIWVRYANAEPHNPEDPEDIWIAPDPDLIPEVFHNDPEVNLVSDTDITISDNSTVNNNNWEGIRLTGTDRINIIATDESQVSSNGRHGIFGIDTWWAKVEITDESLVDSNNRTGIFFTAGQRFYEEFGRDYIDPGLIGEGQDSHYCADCVVKVNNTSEVSQNEGGNANEGGIVMFGVGHRTEIHTNSEVNDNSGHGIFLETYDFSEAFVWNHSEICDNGISGLTVRRSLYTWVSESSVCGNGSNGILVEGYTAERNILPEIIAPRRPNDEIDSLVCIIEDADLTLDPPCSIQQNGANGVFVAGERFLDFEAGQWDVQHGSVEILIDNSDINLNDNSGIRFEKINNADEVGHGYIHVQDCRIDQNSDHGIYFYDKFKNTFAKVISCDIDQNDIDGISILGLRNTDDPHAVDPELPTIFHIIEDPLIGPMTIQNSGRHGIYIEDYQLDQIPASGIAFEMLVDGATIESNTSNGFELGLHDDEVMTEGMVNLTFRNTDINNNIDGIYLNPSDPEDENVIPVNLKIHECNFTGNTTIGLHSDVRQAANIWIAPEECWPSEVETQFDEQFNTQISTFDSHGDWAIFVDYDAILDRPTLLVDRVSFSNDLQEPPNGNNDFIRLRGFLGGFDEDGEPEENWATIRKCLFESGPTGIKYEPDANDVEPNVRIHNNLFVGMQTACIDVTSIGTGITRIFNNTFMNDVQNPDGTGVQLSNPGGVNAAMVSGSIHSNIFYGLATAIDQPNGNANPIYNYQGFFGNTDDGDDYNDAPSLDDDPEFASGIGYGERLAWDSPYINEGNPAKEDSTRLNTEEESYLITRSDIGCTGGGLYAGILDQPHYNVFSSKYINDDVSLAHNGEGDEFEVLGHFTVNPGNTMTITEKTAFFTHENDQIQVKGAMLADGGATRTIKFDRFPAEGRWDYLRFYQPNLNSSIQGCEIKHADRCIYAYGPGNLVEINNCLLEDGDLQNMWISGAIRVICEDSDIQFSNGNGVYFFNNTPANASFFNGCRIKENGDWSSVYDSGVKTKNCNAIFEGCEVTRNFGHGFYLYDEGNVQLNWSLESANTIFNNGTNLNQNHEYIGAEIRMRNSSYPRIGDNNIWDITGIIDNEPWMRYGKFASKDDATNPDTVIVHWSYFGDLWHGAADFTQQMVADRFYWGDTCCIDVQHWVHDYIETGPPVPDSFDDFEIAGILQNEGRYAEAVNCYWSYIHSEQEVGRISNALQQIQACYSGMDNPDWDELKRNYLDFADDKAETNKRLSWSARKRAVYCTMYAGQSDRAIEEYRTMLDSAPCPSDSLLIEMDILYIQSESEEQVDAVHNFSYALCSLENLLESIDGTAENNKAGIPANFSLNTPYPNPFNSTARFSLDLPSGEYVTLKIYDVSGRLVDTVVDRTLTAGTHNLVWNAEAVSAGVYFASAQAGCYKMTQKMLLVR